MNGDLGFWKKFKYGVLISLLIGAVLGTLEALFVSSLLGEPTGLARVKFVLIATLSYGLAGLILGLVFSLIIILIRKPFEDEDSGLAFYFGFYASLYFLLYAGAWIEFNLFPRLQAFRPPRLPGTIFLLAFTPLLYLIVNKFFQLFLRKVERSRLIALGVGILAFLFSIIWRLKSYLGIFRQGFELSYLSKELINLIVIILLGLLVYWLTYLILLGWKFKREGKPFLKKGAIPTFFFLLLIGSIFPLLPSCGKIQKKVEHFPNDINVVFITIDALRPDHLSCYGYERRTSPNIDEVAKKGVLFTQAITQAPYTTTSIASIMSGLYPPRHKVRDLPDQFESGILTLAEIFQEHGYATGAIVSNPLLTPDKGYSQGFESYDLSEQLRFKVERALFLFDVFSPFFPSPRSSDANSTTKEALKWLEKNSKKKFFLWLFYFDPHAPYEPPPLFKKLYPSSNNYGHLHTQAEKVKGKLREAKDILDFLKLKDDIMSCYDAEITYTDQEIGEVLKKLDELGLTEKTLIVITADHGESLGEHGAFFRAHVRHLIANMGELKPGMVGGEDRTAFRAHGSLLYDDVLRIPLILKFPSLIPQGLVLNPQIRAIDIMPTILDIVGLSPPRDLDGISLLPLILGKGEFSSQVSFSESRPNDGLPSGGFSGILGKRRAIRTERWKLIYTPRQIEHLYELYDLGKDPLELKNLFQENKEIFNSLKERLITWIVNSEKGTKLEKTQFLDRTMQERLRALGYID